MGMSDLVRLCRKNIARHQQNAIPNGVIALKGGELQHEIAPFKKIAVVYNLGDFFDEEYFITKRGVFVPVVNR